MRCCNGGLDLWEDGLEGTSRLFVELLGIILGAFEQKKELEIQIHVQVVSIMGNGDTHNMSLDIGEKR